jgi:uncharacterized OB-fold protein
MRLPVQPGLYDADTDVPILNASRCATCGRASFPPLSIGCDICGASEMRLEAIHLPVVGEVRSFATVHVRHGQPIEPFTVAEIALDDGPLIRAVVARGSRELTIGDHVNAAWTDVKTDDAGNILVEPVITAVTA